MLTEKDKQALIKLPNDMLATFRARVMLTDMPESILRFYEENADQINGDVIVVRTKDQEGYAAYIRSTSPKVLFVFGDEYWVGDYFSGVCDRIALPAALLKRAKRSS